MMEIAITGAYARLYRALPEATRKKTNSKVKLFQGNPFHPSLRTKKLEPHHQGMWSFWIDKDNRIAFRFTAHRKVLFLFIGNRKDIYRKL